MTDPERDDALDHLSSEELEAQAFGPDPDRRRSLRGLIDRPASGAVYRVAERKRRWPKVVLGLAAALAVLVTGVAIGADMERGSEVEDVFIEEVSDDYVSDVVDLFEVDDVEAFEADVEAIDLDLETLEEELTVEAVEMEETAEVMEESFGPITEE